MTTYDEYRATWSGAAGKHESIKGSLDALHRDLEGFQYDKPDLKIEKRTVTIGSWEEVTHDEDARQDQQALGES